MPALTWPTLVRQPFSHVQVEADPRLQMLSALSQTTGDSNINPDSVVVNAPNFPNGDDKNVSYPYWTYPPGSKKAAAGGNQSWTTLLVWKASQWAGGGTNQYPNNKSLVSSYDVIDQLVQYYADKSRFPNINQIVVAGHSLGAQTVQRYAAVGKPMSSLGVSVPVSYWIANPNSLVWLNASRPLSTASCATYDNWRDGLAAYSSYPNIYNNDLVSGGTAAVLANYQSKNKAYARGIQDMGDDSTTCAPYTTGSNRHERFYYFINWWTPTCEAPTSATGHCDTVDLVNMGHDGGGMMASTAGRARLFTDNFYGDGARSYDIGYPRIQANVDDPFPDPAYNQTVNQTNAVVYAGNMTFAGCYTDSSIRTLSTLIYDSTSNTIEMCTAACSKAGYSIAGMEFGSQCYCGNNLGSYTQKALDLGCSTPCPGNSTESCGAPNRLSVYSNGLAVQAAAPSNPEVVGNYYFSGCHSESSSGRALSGSSYSDGKNMTLENCAAFCNGYKYFGIEYSAECYCGSYFGSGSAVIADSSCPMTCSGNPLELCGGSGALSVYQLNSDAPVSTIIQGPTTAGSAPTNTGTAASLPSSSLCPATNGMGVQDSNNNTYIIACSSDTSIGSYSNAQTVNSYFDCMIACDNAASSGCVAFTYQGGVSGQGSGTCYLKNAQGSFSAGSSSLVSGFKNATGSTGSSSATTTSAASATTTFANGSTPVVGGVTYLIEANTTYSGTTLTLSKKRAASAIGDCLNTCASSSSCVGTAFDGSVCTYFGAIDTTSKVVAVGTTFATVQSRTAASSTSSSSTAGPSGSCPSANGQTINGYVVSCSSDTNIGSYSSSQATNSYMDCMSACNASASTGCVAWTYVGGTNGQGSGTCYFKNSQGTFVSAGSNLVSGMISSQGSSSSSLSSTQSGLTTGSSSTSSGATSTASSNVCPDSQDITDSNNNIYTIKCSSDTNVGSYANGQAVTSYADCMTICDATTGCVAFTYVGGTAGQGSGICYFKNDRGSATPAGSNLVSGFLKNSVSSSASTSTTASSNILSSSVTSSSTSASSSSSASLCPAANGQIITDSNGNQYNVTCSADNSVGSYTNAQASTSYLDCMNACDFASSSGCQGFTYVGGSNGLGSGTCWLKQSMADYPASGSNFISAVKVANVKNAVVSFSSSSLTSSIVSSTSASSTTSSSTLSSSLSSSVSLSFDSSSASAAASSSSSVSSTSSTVSLSSVISSSSTVSSTTDVSLSASTSSATSTTSSSSVSFTSSSATSTTSSSSASSTSSSVSSTSSNAIIPSTRTTIVSSSSPTTLSTITSSVSSSSTALSLPTGFSSYGCFVDGNPRALAYSAGSTNTNTPYNCASTCQSLGYKYAGTEYGRECWCANAAPTTSAKSTDCNMACSGDNTQSCGAGNRLSVYVDKTWTNKFSARASYGTWNLMACYTDGTNGRVLPQTMSMTGGSNNATIANCLDACAQSGLSVCGAEYYQECYGGSNIPSSNLIAGSDPLTAGCNYPCTGNKTEACGGSNRILVYINNGTVTATSARS
jgi:hypothetical protein